LPCNNNLGCGGPADCNSASCNSGTCVDAATCTNNGGCGGNVCAGGRCFVSGQAYRAPKLGNNPCPQGWTPIGTHGCFLRPPGTKTWYEAFKDCRSMGANLAILPGQTELNAVGKNAAGGNLTSTSSPRVWAGFACVNGNCNNTGNWRWLNNSAVTSSHWGQLDPAVTNQCGSLRIRNNAPDYDVGAGANLCTDTLAYVCQLLPGGHTLVRGRG
jgi:hypothetical protein